MGPASPEHGDAWEGSAEPAQTPAPAAEDRDYRFAAIDSQTFFTTDYKLEWLVKRLLVKGQPCIFGGPKKSLKTTTLIDLAVSLASATPFLGHFDVYRRCRVVLIPGESGEAVLQETGRRICEARGIDPTTLDVHWSLRLPKVASVLDRDALALGLEQLGAGVVVIDPLYLCLLAGMDARDVEAGNLFHMGPLLLDLAQGKVMELCFRITWDVTDGYTRRTYAAHLSIPPTRGPGGGRTLPDNADSIDAQYLENAVPDVPPGFRRASPISRTLFEDKCRLDITVIDEHMPSRNYPPEGAVKVRMRHSVRPGTDFVHWTGSFVGDYEYARGVNPVEGFKAFM